MKKHSYCYSLSLMVCFLMALLSFYAHATNAPVATLGTIGSCPNQSGKVVPMVVSNFTNITSISLRVDFDPTAATFTSGVAHVNFSSSAVVFNVVPVSPTLSKLLIGWFNFIPVSLAASDTLVKLTFTILNGSTALAFNNESAGGGDCEYTDEYGDPMNDLPSSTYYLNGAINSLGVGATGFIAGSGGVCAQANGVAYSIPPVVGATAYAWSLPSGFSIATGENTNAITVNVSNSAASGSISVTPSNFCGAGASSPLFPVTVYPLPVPTITGSANLCVNSGIYEYATESGMVGYLWTLSPGGAITGGLGTNQIQVQWSVAGAQSVSINYSNSGGCFPVSPVVLNVTVNPLPNGAGAITGATELCSGTEGVAYSTPPIPNAGSYIWTIPVGASIVNGNGTPDIVVDFAHTAASGNISVAGNNYCGNGIAASIYVTVRPTPDTPGIYSIADTLWSNAVDGNQWYFEGNAIAGATGQYHVAIADGWYWCVVTLNGCSSDTSNHVYVILTGLPELHGSNVVIYPMPNNGDFTATITSPVQQTFELLVYNTLGQLIYEEPNIRMGEALSHEFDLRPIPNGIYTLVLRQAEGRMVRKIMINK